LSILASPKRLFDVITNRESQVAAWLSIELGEKNMLFLAYDPHYDPDSPEAAVPPSPELMAEMGKFIGEAVQAGVVITTGALKRKGTRLRLANGEFTVTDGPFIELKELMGGFAVLDVDSLEEAIKWSKRFLQIVGDGETEIVQLAGPDDFGPA
jgi:hypothetical protein